MTNYDKKIIFTTLIIVFIAFIAFRLILFFSCYDGDGRRIYFEEKYFQEAKEKKFEMKNIIGEVSQHCSRYKAEIIVNGVRKKVKSDEFNDFIENYNKKCNNCLLSLIDRTPPLRGIKRFASNEFICIFDAQGNCIQPQKYIDAEKGNKDINFKQGVILKGRIEEYEYVKDQDNYNYAFCHGAKGVIMFFPETKGSVIYNIKFKDKINVDDYSDKSIVIKGDVVSFSKEVKISEDDYMSQRPAGFFENQNRAHVFFCSEISNAEIVKVEGEN